jgi:hypothetical protein
VVLLPLGCSIADFNSEEAAEHFVELIADLTNWRAPLPAADPRVLRAVQEARRIAGAVPLAAAA